MKRTLIAGAVVCLIGLGIVQPTNAAEQRGQSSLAWLSISASARDAAMGNTAVFNDRDASAAFTNPAGLGRIERGSAYVNYTQWLAETAVYDVAVAYRMPGIGTFALTVRSLDYGTFSFTELATNDAGYIPLSSDSAGTYGASVIGVAYGRSLTDKFAVGGHVKYVRDSFGKMDIVDRYTNPIANSEAKITGLLFDFGTNYNTGWKSLNLSMTIHNFGTEKAASNGDQENAAPLTFRVGLAADALDFIGMEDAPMSLNVRFEGSDPRDTGERINLGSEFAFDAAGISAAARAGYSNQDVGGLSLGFGIGGSISGTRATLDYAWADYGSALGAVNRFGMSVSF